jgi:hypothetical protein
VMRGPADPPAAPQTPRVAQIAPEVRPTTPRNPESAAMPASGQRPQDGVSLASGDRENRGGVALGGRVLSWGASLAPVGERSGLAAELDGAGRLTVRRQGVDIPAEKTLALWFLTPDRAPSAIGFMSNDIAHFRLDADVTSAEIAASFEPRGAGVPNQPSAPYAYRGRLVRR